MHSNSRQETDFQQNVALWHDRTVTLLHNMGSYYRQHWPIWLAVVLAVITFNIFFKVGINVSESLPDKAFVVAKYDHKIERGNYVSFAWNGSGPYGKGLEFVKIIRGVPGDVVTLEGRKVFINGEYVATAKELSKTRQPLELGPTGVIPPGKYFVFAPHPDSLDSRYALTGWIDEEAILGRAYPIF